jgi:hypothetical protein
MSRDDINKLYGRPELSAERAKKLRELGFTDEQLFPPEPEKIKREYITQVVVIERDQQQIENSKHKGVQTMTPLEKLGYSDASAPKRISNKKIKNENLRKLGFNNSTDDKDDTEGVGAFENIPMPSEKVAAAMPGLLESRIEEALKTIMKACGELRASLQIQNKIRRR